MSSVLLIYSQDLTQTREAIGSAVELLKSQSSQLDITRCSQLETPGDFISSDSLSKIDKAELILLDVTRLNFNIVFEFGYSIGKGKKLLLISDKSVKTDTREVSEIGLFEAIERKDYENSKELVTILENTTEIRPIRQTIDNIDRSSPIYVLDTLHKTDTSLRIISKIKKTRIRFRSFDPTEQSRLSAYEALDEVQKSVAIVVTLLSKDSADNIRNNYRAAFLAGLASGLDKISLILQEGEEPIPLEYRDLVKVYNSAKDIDKYVNILAPQVMESLQSISNRQVLKRPQQLLEKLELGAPAAENEMDTLYQYYVDTDESNRALSGNARLVVGRKGSGKTALFIHIRDELRKTKKNVILDLKPEGHQLKRLKQLVLDLLQEAVKEHVATAFWEYLLLLECCHKLLLSDRVFHTRDGSSGSRVKTV